MTDAETPDNSANDRVSPHEELGYGKPAPTAAERKAARKGKPRPSRARRSKPLYTPFELRDTDHVVTDEERAESQPLIDDARRKLSEIATRSAQELPPARPPINEGDEVSEFLEPPLPVNVVLAIDRGNGADPQTHSFDRTAHIPPKGK